MDTAIVRTCAGRADGAVCNVRDVGEGMCNDGLCLIGTCGDGVINAIDACDGAELGGRTCLDFGAGSYEGLTCAADCSFDTSGCTAHCGDGIKQELEECDGQDVGGESCISMGFYAGDIVCSNACTINVGDCSGRCGDGVANGLEPCDGLDLQAETCDGRGFLGMVSPMRCSPTCALSPMSCLCGDVHCTPNTQRCVLSGSIYSCEAV
ncbi:MAG: hypothetical protein ACKV2T_01900 [Kofleriaceae bacterium]